MPDPQKKVHPHGLPHIHEARRPDGSADPAALAAGMAAWMPYVGTGPEQYSFPHVDEFAVDDKNDIFIIHRRRN